MVFFGVEVTAGGRLVGLDVVHGGFGVTSFRAG